MLWAGSQETFTTHPTPRPFLRKDLGIYISLVQDPRARDLAAGCTRKHSDNWNLEARERLGASVAWVPPQLRLTEAL